MSMTELKPCPLCGGKAKVVFMDTRYRPYSLWYQTHVCCLSKDRAKVKCTKCGIETPVYATGSYAIKKWNTREVVI